MLYDEEEDNLLKELLQEHGCHWGIVGKQFNAKINRKKVYTEAMLRNRYYRITKQKKSQRNKCTKCGQWLRGHSCSMKNNSAEHYISVQLKLKGYLKESELNNIVDLNVLINDVEASLLSKMRPLTHFAEMPQVSYADLSGEAPQMFEEYFSDMPPLQKV